MEITYTMQGDYLLPNLTLPEQDSRTIGLWGQQHLRYIKRSRPILYTNLLTKCKLNEYLADIDEQAQKMYDELVRSFTKEEGCTELLRSTNQMLWVRKMNNATQRAREVVNEEASRRENKCRYVGGAESLGNRAEPGNRSKRNAHFAFRQNL